MNNKKAMKRFLTFLTVLVMTGIGVLSAQTLKKGSFQHAMNTGWHRAAITPEANQWWWGLINDDDNMTVIGTSGTGTYHCAFFLPGNHEVVSGKKLCAVRFGLVAPHATDVKVWTAASLPAGDLTEGNTLWLQDVGQVAQDGFTDVPLTTPYDIPAEGVYVGYSFTITAASSQDDRYPLLVGGEDQAGGLLLRTGNGEWDDYMGYNFGVLAMKVLLEGELTDCLVSPAAVQDICYTEIGQPASVGIRLTNNGSATVNSISYTLEADGVTGEEQTVTLPDGLETFRRATITVSVPAATAASSTKQTLTVTKVNGEANGSANASTGFTLNTLSRFINRNVVVEEFTGTGCGWCPRGLVGMEKLRDTFGDRFIGIGIHQYNEGDAMYIANYPYLEFGGAPSCRIDRGLVIDPYYGSNNDICDDFRAEMGIPAMVLVDVKGKMNEAMTEVEATAYVEPLFDSSDYQLELALVADGLSGTTSAWWQSNYYASQPAAQVPEDLRIFCSGGKYSGSSIKNFVFNDVAVGTSYDKNGKNQAGPLGAMTGGEKREVSCTLSLPTKATLRNALKKGTIYVVALVIDKDGTIANAAKCEVSDTDGISTVCSDSNADTTLRYSLNGMQLTAPQHGINMVRMSDGTVRKVFVK